MEKIDFRNNFDGFSAGEDILMDTGILLAFLNEFDHWHYAVEKLFNDYIYNNDKEIYLYIDACIQNELTHLLSIDNLTEHYVRDYTGCGIPLRDFEIISTQSIMSLKELIENDVVKLLDFNREISLKQLNLCNELGAADAMNVCLADEYGISFLTVDNRLVNRIMASGKEFTGIQKVYYTIPRF